MAVDLMVYDFTNHIYLIHLYFITDLNRIETKTVKVRIKHIPYKNIPVVIKYENIMCHNATCMIIAKKAW